MDFDALGLGFDPCPRVIEEVFKAKGHEVTHALKLDNDWYVLHVENPKKSACSTCVGAVHEGEAVFLPPEDTQVKGVDFVLTVFSHIVHSLQGLE